MSEPSGKINLAELRAEGLANHGSFVDPDTLLALIDVAEAAHRAAANFGIERIDIYTAEHEARDQLREALARFDHEPPT